MLKLPSFVIQISINLGNTVPVRSKYEPISKNTQKPKSKLAGPRLPVITPHTSVHMTEFTV